jgi:site-specific DNA recombinase
MGKVDIVVVYKIDRLSRSLADFARMVDVFDRHRVSFSAVTQQINSATSMGRLMLNVLLSFAQFEREVTGERIRDKIAASKAKGMWMGGPLPLGYDVRDRLLVVNETEAKLVRRIFDDFVTDALGHADGQGLRRGRRGHQGRQALHQADHLQDAAQPDVPGRDRPQGAELPGQHQAIITQAQWDAVHALIATDGIERRRETNDRQREPVLLRGLLFTPDGERLVPSYTVKKGKTYRYYTPIKHRRFGSGPAATGHLPAAPIEDAGRQQIVAALSAPHIVQSVWDRIRDNPPGPLRSRGGAADAQPGHDVATVVPRRAVPPGAIADRARGDRRRRAGNHLARSGLAGTGRGVDARHHRRGTAGMEQRRSRHETERSDHRPRRPRAPGWRARSSCRPSSR